MENKLERYIIEGGNTLDGKVEIKSAKNSVLPLLSASILTHEKVTLHNCPDIKDVDSMLKILIGLGCKIEKNGSSITVDSSTINGYEIPVELAKELRSSIFLLGSMLTRLKKAKVAYPGGCEIGIRPVDIHIAGLKELSIDIQEEYGYINCDGRNSKSSDIVLDLPSVGATENIILASVQIKGRTVIRNCAKEPEIVDLQNMLNKMGARVRGAGGSVITIDGVSKLNGIEYTPIPDRIVAGTYLIGCVMTGGRIELCNTNAEHISSLISKLSKTTCKIGIKNDKILISSYGRQKSFDNIETMYYPGFPTDLQTQLMAMQTTCKGTCVIVENIFETRFKTAAELKKLGANITVKDRMAVVRGVPYLKGGEVNATDLRGGASLVLAGMCAKGRTIINDIYHIDRGYDKFEENLQNLGVNIKRIT